MSAISFLRFSYDDDILLPVIDLRFCREKGVFVLSQILFVFTNNIRQFQESIQTFLFTNSIITESVGNNGKYKPQVVALLLPAAFLVLRDYYPTLTIIIVRSHAFQEGFFYIFVRYAMTAMFDVSI